MANTLGPARHRQVRVHHDPPAAADLQPELGAQPARLARPPPTPACGPGCAVPSARWTSVGLDLLHGGVEQDLDAQLAQLGQRPRRQARREGAEHAVGRLDEHDAGPAHVEVA